MSKNLDTKALQLLHFPEGTPLPDTLPQLLGMADVALQQFINGLYKELIKKEEGEEPSELDLFRHATKTIAPQSGVVIFFWKDKPLLEFTPHGFCLPKEDGGETKWRRAEVAILEGAKVVDASAN